MGISSVVHKTLVDGLGSDSGSDSGSGSGSGSGSDSGSGSGSGFGNGGGKSTNLLEMEGLLPELDTLNRQSKLPEFLEAELELLGRIRYAQQVIFRTVADLWGARSMRRRAFADVRAAVARLDGHIGKLEQRKKALEQRYKALYKLADRSLDRSLLDTRWLTVDIDGRVELARVLARDMRELDMERAVANYLQRQVSNARGALKAGKRMVMKLDRRRDGLAAHRARMWQLVRDIRRRKERRNRDREVWDRRSKRLNRAVADMELLVRREARSFVALKGRLPRPVPGLVLDQYGERKVAGTRITEKRQGVEITSLKGWRARSPARGLVKYVGVVPGFAHVVMVDHGEGFLSVVGYLSGVKVAAGQAVRAGQVLGQVGGSPQRKRGQPRTCYFELRRGAIPLDPAKWLRGGRRSRKFRKRRGPSGQPVRPTRVAGK